MINILLNDPNWSSIDYISEEMQVLKYKNFANVADRVPKFGTPVAK